jgi:predicted O-methyltransferase YrrM
LSKHRKKWNSSNKYEFTNDWFEDSARKVWDKLIPSTQASKVLEIGSFEGASTCYLIDTLAHCQELELHCIDTWDGGADHKDLKIDMTSVEGRFQRNVEVSIARARHSVQLRVHKSDSLSALAALVTEGRRGYFDFIYVDGSHIASDVLSDAVLAFSLLRVGGVLAFDDYLWTEDLRYGRDILRCPKAAIDAFINLNFRELSIIAAPLRQIYVRKELHTSPPKRLRIKSPSLIGSL